MVEAWRISLNVHAHVAIPPGATTLAVPLTALLPPAPPPGRRAAPAPLGKLACVVSRPDFLSPEGPAAAPPGAGGAPDAAVTLRVIPAAAASAAHLRLIDEASGALLPLLHAGPPRHQLPRRFSADGRPAALAAPRARAPRADEPASEEWGLDEPPTPPAPPPLHEAWFRLDIHRSRHGALQASITVDMTKDWAALCDALAAARLPRAFKYRPNPARPAVFVTARTPADYAMLCHLVAHAAWRAVFAFSAAVGGDADFVEIETQRRARFARGFPPPPPLPVLTGQVSSLPSY